MPRLPNKIPLKVASFHARQWEMQTETNVESSQTKVNMVQYRIVCTTPQPFGQPANHAHVVAIGTGTSNGHDKYWTLDQVLMAMADGDIFYTVSSSTCETVLAERYFCTRCSKYFIRSGPHAVADNNLNNLPFCRS